MEHEKRFPPKIPMPPKGGTGIAPQDLETMRFLELTTMLCPATGGMTREIGRAGKFIRQVGYGYWLYEQYDFLVGRWGGSYRVAHLEDISRWTLYLTDDDLAAEMKNNAKPVKVN